MLFGFRLLLAVGTDDTEPLESPLVLSVARQLVAGPWELYGPFGGKNPLVLIHAPLYYRLAALASWPLEWAGLDPVSAARLAGRLLSLVGLAATLAATFRLARLDGAPRRAGWMALLLLAATPALDGMPITVRPDMLGVAVQTTGVVILLSALRLERPRAAAITWAYAAFALALCVKQQLLAVPAVSAAVVLRARRRGKVARGTLERGLVVALAIVGAVYGAETVASGGRIWQAVFVAAAALRRVHPGGWLHVATVAAAVLGKSAGLVALLAAAGLGAVAHRPAIPRWMFPVGAFTIATITALSAVQLAIVRPWISGPLIVAVLFCAAIVIPHCVLVTRRSTNERRDDVRWLPADQPGAGIERTPTSKAQTDAALWVYWLGELVLVVVLSAVTTGAWINYAIQAIVFVCVLTARTLERGLWAVSGVRTSVPAALAACVVLASVLMEIKEIASERRAERAELAQTLAQVRRPGSELFFAGRPGLNRIHGRLDLVYDDWLYPVFEALELAEPRSRWLRSALVAGPVRVVVCESDSPRLGGIPDLLPALGYRSSGRIGRFRVWVR
jgi:hypothetical protein